MMGLMKVKQVAEHLGVSESFVYALMQGGRLKHHVLGNGQGAKRVSMEQIQEYLHSVEKGGQPQPSKPRQPAQKIKLKHLTL
jgi:excisionase family DNA binding protein